MKCFQGTSIQEDTASVLLPHSRVSSPERTNYALTLGRALCSAVAQANLGHGPLIYLCLQPSVSVLCSSFAFVIRNRVAERTCVFDAPRSPLETSAEPSTNPVREFRESDK